MLAYTKHYDIFLLSRYHRLPITSIYFHGANLLPKIKTYGETLCLFIVYHNPILLMKSLFSLLPSPLLPFPRERFFIRLRLWFWHSIDATCTWSKFSTHACMPFFFSFKIELDKFPLVLPTQHSATSQKRKYHVFFWQPNLREFINMGSTCCSF